MIYKTGYTVDFHNRKPVQGGSDLFYKRWSPRSFKKVEIPMELLEPIFDAARWAPSCFNEQPWKIVTSSGESDFNLFLHLLTEKNQMWAKNASVLGFIFAKRTFSHNGKENRWAQFDCGSAWMSLTLQARLHGLYTHGMGGIKKEETYNALNVSKDEYEVVCGFALGVIDTPDKLPETFVENEIPSKRKPLHTIWHNGIG